MSTSAKLITLRSHVIYDLSSECVFVCYRINTWHLKSFTRHVLSEKMSTQLVNNDLALQGVKLLRLTVFMLGYIPCLQCTDGIDFCNIDYGTQAFESRTATFTNLVNNDTKFWMLFLKQKKCNRSPLTMFWSEMYGIINAQQILEKHGIQLSRPKSQIQEERLLTILLCQKTNKWMFSFTLDLV